MSKSIELTKLLFNFVLFRQTFIGLIEFEIINFYSNSTIEFLRNIKCNQVLKYLF